jgi:hypothetical protein
VWIFLGALAQEVGKQPSGMVIMWEGVPWDAGLLMVVISKSAWSATPSGGDWVTQQHNLEPACVFYSHLDRQARVAKML